LAIFHIISAGSENVVIFQRTDPMTKTHSRVNCEVTAVEPAAMANPWRRQATLFERNKQTNGVKL